MALVNYNEVLNFAREHKITVGAFNALNMETAQALISAADKMRSPLILQTYHAHVDYAGADYIRAIADVATRHTDMKIAMGLDHGRSYEQAKSCVDNLYTGVMIDLASENYDFNVEETRKVVALAHGKGISVEAELGMISDADRSLEEIAAGYTDPVMAKSFVEDTGIDCLAVSIGTAHGIYKYTPKINFDLLGTLLEEVACPIVVHGGSNTPDEEVERMVKMGISKLNVGTDFFNAYKRAIREVFETKGEDADIVEIMAAARKAVEEVAIHKLEILTKFRV